MTNTDTTSTMIQSQIATTPLIQPSSPRQPFWLATAAVRSTHIATTWAATFSGQPLSASTSLPRPDLTSSCTGAGWRNAVLAASTLDRRLSTVCGSYRFAPIDGRVAANPAQYVRRPAAHPTEARGLDRSELGRFPFAAERHDHDHAALAVLLGLNGLRVSEGCATNIEGLGVERVADPRQGRQARGHPPRASRTAPTIDLAVGERCQGPILCRRDRQRLDRRTCRWVRSIGKRAGLGLVHPHMLQAAFIMAALDAGVPRRDGQIAARHADPRTSTVYDRRRQNFDRHAAYVVVSDRPDLPLPAWAAPRPQAFGKAPVLRVTRSAISARWLTDPAPRGAASDTPDSTCQKKALIKARKRRVAALAAVAAVSVSTGLFSAAPSAVADNGIASRSYQQNNLVSDIPGLAAHTDPNLRNSWGTSTGRCCLRDCPIWVSDNATGKATLYDGQGNPRPGPGRQQLAVSIPAPPSAGAGAVGAPDGTVFNTASSGFVISKDGVSAPSRFLFATEDGTIVGWNPAVDPTHAVIAVDRSTATDPIGDRGAVYKGLALVSTPAGNFLYATNFRFGTVEVFDSNFNLVNTFTDPTVPAGFAPFGIHNIGGDLFVTFAKQDAAKFDDDATCFADVARYSRPLSITRDSPVEFGVGFGLGWRE